MSCGAKKEKALSEVKPEFGIELHNRNAEVVFDKKFMTNFTTAKEWPDLAIFQCQMKRGDSVQTIVLPKDELGRIIHFLEQVYAEWQERVAGE